MDSQLKFDVHVNNIVPRAHNMANLIHKCFVLKDPPTLMKAFLVYVKPILEYASCVWSPQSVGLIKTRGSAIADEPRDALRQLKYYGPFLTKLLTRSSANPEEPCEHTVS